MMDVIYTIAKVVVYPFFWLIYGFRVEGRANFPYNSKKLIVCSNHRSALDPILLALALPKHLAFMAKESLFRVPVLRWIFNQLHAVPIRRGKSDVDALRKGIQAIESGWPFLVFPEGTRTLNGARLPAKTGVGLMIARTGADVLPVSVECKGKIRPFGKVVIKIGKPILSEEIGLTNPSHSEYSRVSEMIMDRVYENLEH